MKTSTGEGAYAIEKLPLFFFGEKSEVERHCLPQCVGDLKLVKEKAALSALAAPMSAAIEHTPPWHRFCGNDGDVWVRNSSEV